MSRYGRKKKGKGKGKENNNVENNTFYSGWRYGMKTVFIFGAGASKQAGAPLMSNFLDCAEDLLRTKTPGVVEAKEEFEEVFDVISELQGVHSKSYLDLDNIEIVFGAIEMGLLLKRLSNRRDKDSIEKLRNSLITLIYKTIERSIQFPVRHGRIFPPKPYDSFLSILNDVLKKSIPSRASSIIFYNL